MSARCRCGAYVPAARVRAGKDECASCEREMDANFTRYAPVNAALDAIEAAPVVKYRCAWCTPAPGTVYSLPDDDNGCRDSRCENYNKTSRGTK